MGGTDANDFYARLNGRFHGILQWQQLDALWAGVKSSQWYFYQVGEVPPDNSLSGDELAARIGALNTLLHHEHAYHYCGIVYVDDVESPSLIKIYDPNNIGSSCSRSETPTPPGWVLSVAPPSLIESHALVPNNRRRWWQLFHNE
ncbi:MAG: hypothetical protein WC825_06295 [Gallionellaceae bacterium]|jgi:hypothetical protein